MDEVFGIAAAIVSSAIGGVSVGATRYVAGSIDVTALAALRYAIGFVVLLPFVFFSRFRRPSLRDMSGIAILGLLFFACFPILFNASLTLTTASRAALALSTAPLLTMIAGSVAGMEALTVRKSLGVMIAIGGVGVALLSGLAAAPDGAWRGDLLMIGAALCMALYNVKSRRLIRVYGALPFTMMSMAIGSGCLVLLTLARGTFAPIVLFGRAEWIAVAYLGTFGSGITFLLLTYALGKTSPTRVAITVPLLPVTGAVCGALLLNEPIRWTAVVGMLTVFAGIWLAVTMGRRRLPDRPSLFVSRE